MAIHKNVITIIGAIRMATMKSSVILLAILVVSIIGAIIFSISILSSISPPAHSTFPGENSKIAFSSDRDGNTLAIYVMNADGTNTTRLTNNNDFDRSPSWSPDGEKIAFTSDRDGNTEIYVMNADDGSGQTRLTYNSALDEEPRWSPDGKKIAFVSTRDQISTEIYVMNADDGSGQTRLTYNSATDSHPDWAPTPPPLPLSEPIQTFLRLHTRDVPWGKDVTVTGKLVVHASNNAEGGEGIGGKTITFDGTGADNLPNIVVTNADGTFTAKGA